MIVVTEKLEESFQKMMEEGAKKIGEARYTKELKSLDIKHSRTFGSFTGRSIPFQVKI